MEPVARGSLFITASPLILAFTSVSVRWENFRLTHNSLRGAVEIGYNPFWSTAPSGWFSCRRPDSCGCNSAARGLKWNRRSISKERP